MCHIDGYWTLGVEMCEEFRGKSKMHAVQEHLQTTLICGVWNMKKANQYAVY